MTGDELKQRNIDVMGENSREAIYRVISRIRIAESLLERIP